MAEVRHVLILNHGLKLAGLEALVIIDDDGITWWRNPVTGLGERLRSDQHTAGTHVGYVDVAPISDDR